jgi:hypothetical protein
VRGKELLRLLTQSKGSLICELEYESFLWVGRWKRGRIDASKDF